MARGDITIRYEARPCIYRRPVYLLDDMSIYEYTDEKAIWHGWVHNHGCMYAVLEFRDGHIEQVRSEKIRFADNAFSEYSWPEEE